MRITRIDGDKIYTDNDNSQAWSPEELHYWNAATPTGADIARFWKLAKSYHDGRISASQSHELNVLEDKLLGFPV